MIYQCKMCNMERGMGFLPGATCGIYFFPLMTFAAVLILKVIPQGHLNGLGWWWVVGVPVLLVVAFIGGYILDLALSLVEWILVHIARCPHCGGRRWSWGFTRGFGL